jgi:hypothetical protein
VAAHDLGERLSLAAGVDELAGDSGVRRADDLFAGQVRADLITTVDAGDDRADAEGDQEDAAGAAASTKQVAHDALLGCGGSGHTRSGPDPRLGIGESASPTPGVRRPDSR